MYVIKLTEDATRMNCYRNIPQYLQRKENFYLTSFTRLDGLIHLFSIHLPKHFEALTQLQIFLEIKNASEWLSLLTAYSVLKSGLVSFRFEKAENTR